MKISLPHSFNCSVYGCHADAILVPFLCWWPPGVDREIVCPVSGELGIALCEHHRQTFTLEGLDVRHLFNSACLLARVHGRVDPDMNTLRVLWARLTL